MSELACANERHNGHNITLVLMLHKSSRYFHVGIKTNAGMCFLAYIGHVIRISIVDMLDNSVIVDPVGKSLRLPTQ